MSINASYLEGKYVLFSKEEQSFIALLFGKSFTKEVEL